jgi:hypothetical protein
MIIGPIRYIIHHSLLTRRKWVAYPKLIVYDLSKLKLAGKRPRYFLKRASSFRALGAFAISKARAPATSISMLSPRLEVERLDHRGGELDGETISHLTTYIRPSRQKIRRLLYIYHAQARVRQIDSAGWLRRISTGSRNRGVEWQLDHSTIIPSPNYFIGSLMSPADHVEHGLAFFLADDFESALQCRQHLLRIVHQFAVAAVGGDNHFIARRWS